VAEAAALLDDLDLPPCPAFPPEALAAAGLAATDVGSIRDVLAAYDRTNAMALVALSALLSRLNGEPPAILADNHRRTAVSRSNHNVRFPSPDC